MARIRMLETRKGALSSTEIVEYTAGREYGPPQITPDLVDAFVSMGVGERIPEAAGVAPNQGDGSAPAAIGVGDGVAPNQGDGWVDETSVAKSPTRRKSR